jgi:putative oxidoreductase
MHTLVALAAGLDRLTRLIAEKLRWLPPTLARVTVGWVFLQSGWGKLHDLRTVIDFFASLGIPAPWLQAPFASATELVCGTLILLGLATRYASVPLIITMIVAIATAQKENVQAVPDLFALIEFLYIVVLVWLGVAGPGPLALDHLLARRRRPAPAGGAAGCRLASDRA